MAAFALTDTEIYVWSGNQSCYSNNVAVDRSGNAVDATTFCSAGWQEFVPGLQTWTMSFAGPQDLAATAATASYTPDENYGLFVGSPYEVLVVPTSGAEGAVAYGSRSMLNAYTPLSGSVGALAEHNLELVPWLNTPLVRGVYATKETVTATGSGTGHQVGAVSADQRVYAGLHVVTVSGSSTPTITARLESDDNSGFSSATTRHTFTAATARYAEWASVAGAITDDYWRLAWTVSGSSPVFTVRGFIGIQ